jgi:peptide/nickel transport system ATP-binding protein
VNAADRPVLLKARGLTQRYRLPRQSLWAAAPMLTALHDVSFSLQPGRTLGVVGESGSGKSTLARLVMALEKPAAGELLFEGSDLNRLDAESLRQARRHFQMVFQDPASSLDPRMKVARSVAEPLEQLEHLNKAERRERAAAMLDAVGLNPQTDLDKYPHEFSGGQRQRIAIARALVTQPKLIVADEPVSALDVSVQAQVLNLMQDLQERFGLAYLFISHDLAVVDLVCDDLLVLDGGQVVEQGPADVVLRAPSHAVTRKLIEAAPRPAWAVAK